MGVHASLALKTNWHTTVNRAQIPGKKDHPGLNGLNGYHRTNINISSNGWGGERMGRRITWTFGSMYLLIIRFLNLRYQMQYPARYPVQYHAGYPAVSPAEYPAGYPCLVSCTVSCTISCMVSCAVSCAVSCTVSYVVSCAVSFAIWCALWCRVSFTVSLNQTIFNIICWVAGSIVSSTKRLMVQVLFL